VLAEYRTERNVYLAAGAILTLTVLWFGAVLLSKLRREESVENALLSESEARFRSLTELASDMYWEQDAQHPLRLDVRRRSALDDPAPERRRSATALGLPVHQHTTAGLGGAPRRC